MLNGSLECELREYIIFEGDKKSFLAAGGKLKNAPAREERRSPRGERRPWAKDDRRDRSFRKGGDRAPFRRDDRAEGAAPEAPSENPLAVRRNPAALKGLVGRKPSLPPEAGAPVMRSRGWKKKGDM